MPELTTVAASRECPTNFQIWASPVSTRSYDSLDAGRRMGERDEETSDVPGHPGDDDGEGFRPTPGDENTCVLPVHMR
jgi:hypothetical protein